MENLKKFSLVIVSLAMLFTVIILTVYLFSRNYNPKKINNLPINNQEIVVKTPEAKNNQNLPADKTICPKGWEHYKQDVIGIGFCYPKEWGKPGTNPIENLTRISDMEEEFRTQHIYYENLLYIGFEKNSQMHIALFNNQYNGNNEPHVYYGSGATEDIVNLKNSGNICDYKVGYDYRYNAEMKADTLKTIYSDCSSAVKTVLTENKEIFDFGGYDTLYTYDLRLLSFKKLVNGYFDNALISREVDKVNQIHESLSTLDEFFNGEKTNITKESVSVKNKAQFEQESREFSQFINTIASYKPVPKAQSDFEEISGEDSNNTLIRKYYWLLSSGKLNEAYEMRSSVNNVSLEKFQEWYKNLYYAKPYDVKKKGSENYEFYVDYQDHNNPKTKFRVEMSVDKSNKLKTISSVEFLTDTVSFGKYSAYAFKRENKNYMILAEGGKEIVIDEARMDYNENSTDINEFRYFRNPRFSPKGNYLIYSASGYEWVIDHVYDLTRRKELIQPFNKILNFTLNDDYMYSCNSAGMDTASGNVYKAPDFKVVYDVFSDPQNYSFSVDCSYDSKSDAVVFSLGDENGNMKRTVKYLLKEGKEKVAK